MQIFFICICGAKNLFRMEEQLYTAFKSDQQKGFDCFCHNCNRLVGHIEGPKKETAPSNILIS